MFSKCGFCVRCSESIGNGKRFLYDYLVLPFKFNELFSYSSFFKYNRTNSTVLLTPHFLNIFTLCVPTVRSEIFRRAAISLSCKPSQHIVEFEQYGKERAVYGDNLLNRLSHDLTLAYGKGFSRSNVAQIRQFYLRFPKIQTLSGQLSWSHYV